MTLLGEQVLRFAHIIVEAIVALLRKQSSNGRRAI
jgi:hypothetical protein